MSLSQELSASSLRDLIRDRGLSYDAVAVMSDIDTSAVSRIVNGKRQARPETIVKLARGLGVSAKRLKVMADAAYEAAHGDRENAA